MAAPDHLGPPGKNFKRLPDTPKREGVPTTAVFPYPSDLKTDIFEKRSNVPAGELVTVLGVDGFALHELKIEVRMLDAYALLLRTLEVHLDPRLDGIPKCAMPEASEIKVRPQLSIEAM